MNFRQWLSEATFNHGKNSERMKDLFGQHVDHIDDKHWYWKWALNKMQTDPTYSPSFLDNNKNPLTRDQVVSMLQQRASGKKISNQPAKTQAVQTTQKSMSQIWTLAQMNNSDEFLSSQKDKTVVASKRPDGNWNIMNRSGQVRIITDKEAISTLVSTKDENQKQIKSANAKDLFARIQEKLDLGDYKKKPELSGYEAPANSAFGENPSTIATQKYNERPSPSQVRIKPEHMTQYNKAIEEKFNSVDQTTGKPENIMIEALAGTGKTSMLKHLSSLIKPGERWLYLVFNKKNQVESVEKFPVIKEGRNIVAGVDVYTTHSFLGKILKKAGKEQGGETQLPPEDAKWKKILKIADVLIPNEWPESDFNYRNREGERVSPFNYKAKSIVTKLASLGKAFGINPQLPSIKNDLMGVVKKYNMDMDLSTDFQEQDRDFTEDIVEMAAELMQVTMPGQTPERLGTQYSNYRDQDDTLWYAAIFADKINWKTPYNVVLMDECQDFNECQLIMARKLKEAGARIIAVGDKNQSMYSFRGSDEEAFDKLMNIVNGPNKKSCELPINFRSGGIILDFVRHNTHVKDIQTAPHMEGKGSVDTETNSDEFVSMLQSEYAQGNRKLKQETAIISRTNAPLAKIALNLLKNNVEFQIIGKDLSKELTGFVRRVTKGRPEKYDIMNLDSLFSNFLEETKNKWGKKISKQAELTEIKEFTEALSSVLEYLEASDFKKDLKSQPLRNGKDFIMFLEEKLGGLDPDNVADFNKIKSKDPKSVIKLTSAHKSKGLEFDRIMVLDPSAFNPQGDKIRTQAEAQQEMNSWYVALTRAKDSLYVEKKD